MALRYGFFNSISGDRVYNADDVNSFLEGLITPNGIFANVDDMFQVTPNSGLTLNIGPGKAMILNHWLRSDATETVTLPAAHAILNRYDGIVLRLDQTNREISLTTIQGTPSSTPSVPEIVRDGQTYDICLAYIYVSAGATAITQSNIIDMRLDSSVCGLIAGLIQQLDTSQFMAQLEAWKVEQQYEFEEWFETLTDELNVNTYIKQYKKSVSGTVAQIKDISLDMTGYTYSDKDIIMVSINGLTSDDWILEEIPDPNNLSVIGSAIIHLNMTASDDLLNEACVRILKSKIGQA